MPDLVHDTDHQSMSSLVGGIIEDIQRLFRQEIALARREIQAEWAKTKSAAVLLGSGIAVLALGGVLLGVMCAKLLALVLPEWAGFAIAGVVFIILGGILIASAVATINRIHVVPPRTAQSLEEDIEAVSNAVSPGGASPGPHPRV
jgi:membrane-bound ClpP family serine protease